MSVVESKKMKAEILRVSAAKAEMEYLIEQKREEIARLEDAIKKQEATEIALQEKMKLTQGVK